ncbi:MAG: hypothetical protein M1144_01865 [Candidatus Thermoplasmatota archaeon]|jgi:hypothetical protein|nr:hypothetical protein [Candidatus Thermoplasmatota archaeon]MCL5984030.1 hypothetical protein [Candidatus Thermoplasmatota archaeon]
MPSKKDRPSPTPEERCYVCRRSKTEVGQFFQEELAEIAKSTVGQVTDLQKKVKEIQKQISALESFQKKLKKDISWETAIREPEAMMEFIPGLKEVWPTLFSTEPEMAQSHTLSAQSRLTIRHLELELQRVKAALDLLKDKPRTEVSLPFSLREILLYAPFYQLNPAGNDVERIEKEFVLKIFLCKVCASLLSTPSNPPGTSPT